MSEKIHQAAILMTANDEIQANIVESLLKVYGIPVERKYKGNDTYGKIILGVTIHGIDLYVPESALEEAKQIIENDMPEEEGELQVCEETEESNQELLMKYDKRRRNRAWIALLFFVPGIVVLAGVAIYWIISLMTS